MGQTRFIVIEGVPAMQDHLCRETLRYLSIALYPSDVDDADEK